MKNLKQLFFGILFSSISFSSSAIQPLSCEVLMLLVGVTAMQRDNGIPRNRTTVAIDKEREFTAEEKKFILDMAYITGKNLTPDQIKDKTYEACRKVRR